jgi:hypothetical protein
MTLTDSFAAFGATLVNRYWACSAIANGALVFSLWSMFLEPSPDAPRRYKDNLNRWTRNPLGSQLAREHLSIAFTQKLPVRLVIAFSKYPNAVKKGAAARGGNTWTVRKDLVGKVTSFDGNNFVIDFQLET